MPTLALMPFEKLVCECRAKVIVLMGGRGAGKGHAIQSRMKLLTTRYPGFRYFYVAPLSGMSDEVCSEMCASDFKRFIRRSQARPYPRIRLKNGSQIWFRSCQRWSSLVSTSEDEITVDESQSERITGPDVETTLLPMLGRRPSPAGGRGVLLLSGQFRGEDWRWPYYLRGLPPIVDGKPNPLSRQPMHFSLRVPSSEGFAYSSDEGRAELEFRRQTTDPRIWAEQFECVPMSNSNAVFDAGEIDAISINRDPRIDVERRPMRSDEQYQCYIDLGGIVDEVALIVACGNEVVNAVKFPLGRHDAVNAREAMAIAARFKAFVVADFTGADEQRHGENSRAELYRREAQRHGLYLKEFFFGPKNVERLTTNLRIAIQQGDFGIAADLTAVCAELKAYEFRYLPKSHRFEYGSRVDDYVQCAKMLVECLNKKWIPDPRAIYHGMY